MKKFLAASVICGQLAFVAGAQQSTQETPQSSTQHTPGFMPLRKDRSNATTEMVRQFNAPLVDSYVLDDGDEISIDVWGRSELSGKHAIGPDGRITLPLVGGIVLTGKTNAQAEEAIKAALSRYYDDLSVTLSVDKYTSFKVMVLGRVGVPGALSFDHQPTLLDVITKAAGLPIGGIGADKAALVRCAIFRGNDRVIWIDLKALLSQGQLELNIRLARNDVLYLPDGDDQLVYVLGDVKTPGAYHLTSTMSFMDALALAGGPTEDGAISRISLVRTSNGATRQIALSGFLNGTSKSNFTLEESDIIYVPPRKLATFGYVLQKISPITGFAILGTVGR